MSLTAPIGGIALAAHRLALTLANCPAWISWTESVDESQAIDRVYFGALPPPPAKRDSYTVEELQALRPYAVVFMEERGGGYELEYISEHGWQDSGRLHVIIEDNIPESIKHDPQEIERQFFNNIGGVLGTDDTPGFMDLASTAPDEDHIYLAARRVRVFGPFRADESEATGQGDHVYALLTIDWGPR